jgi:thiamine pyrophosphokinase
LNKCIILANGKPPVKSTIEFLQSRSYKSLICADGGANRAVKLNLIPQFIIGDLDSIKKSTINFYKNKSEIVKFERQNDTDVEKCLKFAIEKKFNDIILLGVTGNRLDHTFCNLGIVIKFFKKIKLKILAENSLLIPYSGIVKLRTFTGEIISLYGFDEKTRIKSSGLKYPLNNISLPFGKKESTSNEALTDEIHLEVKGGIIFIIRDFNAMRRKNLF